MIDEVIKSYIKQHLKLSSHTFPVGTGEQEQMIILLFDDEVVSSISISKQENNSYRPGYEEGR